MFLSEKEKMLKDVDELIVVDDMHERKMLMFKRADAFVALPGGIGTLEELVEQLTWSQLGQHGKPVVIANIADFWSPFLSLLEHMREQKFIRDGLEVSFEVVDRAEDIVPAVQRLAESTTPVPDAISVAGRSFRREGPRAPRYIERCGFLFEFSEATRQHPPIHRAAGQHPCSTWRFCRNINSRISCTR